MKQREAIPGGLCGSLANTRPLILTVLLCRCSPFWYAGRDHQLASCQLTEVCTVPCVTSRTTLLQAAGSLHAGSLHARGCCHLALINGDYGEAFTQLPQSTQLSTAAATSYRPHYTRPLCVSIAPTSLLPENHGQLPQI